MNVLTIMLQAGGGNFSMIIMMVAIFAIMYFFMIRPQQKRQKYERRRVGYYRAAHSDSHRHVLNHLHLAGYRIGDERMSGENTSDNKLNYMRETRKFFKKSLGISQKYRVCVFRLL